MKNDIMQTEKKTLLTVVTVVYNGKDALEETIRNVVHQTYPHIEYLIVDGGSDDGSVDIIRRYESRITSWKSEKDTGIYNAMNKGTRMAAGEWICFLNCGDVFVDNAVVRHIAENIAAFSEPDVVYGNIFVKSSAGSLIERKAKEPCNIHRMYFCHQSAFVKTSVMRKYMFDERHEMSADYKFFKQCYFDDHTFVHIDFPVVIYDTNGISNTCRIKGLRDNIAVIKEIDKGYRKYIFMFRLYFGIYWRMITGKK